MSLRIQSLPYKDQAALSNALPAHVDPAELTPQQALELLWQSGHLRTAADAWAAVSNLARAEAVSLEIF